jgi:CarD family transcriptional regulator
MGMATQNKKPAAKKLKFKANEYVVYPAHGVGKIVSIEEQEIAGLKLELYVIDFDKEKMRLRVPTSKCESVGMRKLADKPLIEEALKVLKGRARIKRTMWSRRAQEYEAKINSGDLIAVAEVVRVEEATAVTEIENVLEKFSRRGDKGEESAAERAA